jgi:hypothetical protein
MIFSGNFDQIRHVTISVQWDCRPFSFALHRFLNLKDLFSSTHQICLSDQIADTSLTLTEKCSSIGITSSVFFPKTLSSSPVCSSSSLPVSFSSKFSVRKVSVRFRRSDLRVF